MRTLSGSRTETVSKPAEPKPLSILMETEGMTRSSLVEATSVAPHAANPRMASVPVATEAARCLKCLIVRDSVGLVQVVVRRAGRLPFVADWPRVREQQGARLLHGC